LTVARYVAPCGDVTVSGVWINMPYLRHTMEKLGIEIQFDRRKEYKVRPSALAFSFFEIN
jgi:hypothetical protein